MEDYSALLEHAIELGGRRKYRDAADVLIQLISQTDQYPQAYLYLGRSYHALGEYSRAVDVLRHFLRRQPDSAAGYFFAGRSFLSAGRARSAAEYLERAVSLRPGFTSALQLLGYAYLKCRLFDRAVAVLEDALELAPDNRKLRTGYLNALFVYAIRQFRIGEYRYAGTLFRYLLEQGREHILIHIHLGMVHRMEGEVEEAIEAYQRALGFAPEDELLRFRLAVLLLEAGRSPEAFTQLDQIQSIPEAKMLAQREADRFIAEHFYEQRNFTQALHHALQAIKRDSGDIQMRLLAAESYRELEEFEFAHNHFQRVVDIDRYHLGAHLGIAMVMWQQQAFQEMLGRLKRIERIDPGNEYAHYYWLLCRWKLDDEPQELLRDLETGVDELGADAYLSTALGDTCERLDLIEQAVSWYRDARMLAPSMTLPYIRLIGLYNDGYEIDDIGRLFRDYLQLEARDRRLRGQYIRYLFQEGAYPSVLEQIDLLLPDTEHPVYYTRLKALTYRHMGDYAAATALYWRLLTEEPEHQGYLRALTYCLNKEGKRSTAIALLEKASSYLKEVDAELHLIHGVLLFQERDWERSLAAFREAASQRPGDWRPYYNIGEIYRRRGMRDFARRFLERAERLKAESEGDNR